MTWHTIRLFAGIALGLGLLGCASKPSVPDNMLSPSQIREQAALASQYGNHGAAIAAWKEALRADAKQREALLGLGQAHLAMGEPRQALDWFDRRLGDDKNDADAIEGRALALIGLGQQEEATPLLRRLAATTPVRWRSCNALGLLADLDGNWEQARHWYEQALKASPNEIAVLNNLGYSRLMARDYVDAEARLNRALALAPDAPRLQGNLVLAIAWQGDFERAVQQARQWQSEPSALNNVGYVALLRGDIDVAIRYFQLALDRSPTWYPRAAANLERARAVRLSQAAPGGELGGAVD